MVNMKLLASALFVLYMDGHVKAVVMLAAGRPEGNSEETVHAVLLGANLYYMSKQMSASTQKNLKKTVSMK